MFILVKGVLELTVTNDAASMMKMFILVYLSMQRLAEYQMHSDLLLCVPQGAQFSYLRRTPQKDSSGAF